MNNNRDVPAPLSVNDFSDYFQAVHGYRPFRWQERLAKHVCRGAWPQYIKLPTSSGKTAAIDIAVFALAFQAANSNRSDSVMSSPRRIFFVVDRRIIVNEAYRRARRVAEKLRDALRTARQPESADNRQNTVTRVARWLQHLAGDDTAPPLDCFELRGGIYRDDAWVRSPLQPTVLTSTVDQVGSRLLFRGYGVTDRNLSIHAALTANDSLMILDEAHCSRPFSQTMEAIERFRGGNWTERVIETPLQFVQMTATPPLTANGDRVLELGNADYDADRPLEKRHGCSKPVTLVLARGAKGKRLTETLAKSLVEQAEKLADEHQLRRIAIVVNRVAIARAAFGLLKKRHAGCASLMIGRMRPCDRDQLTEFLQREFGAVRGRKDNERVEDGDAAPRFVVATQCLEVGADLDFDGMISQCASLDALRQRFGRLNRLGESPRARGVIIATEEDTVPLDKLDEAKPLDPIYGNALVRTWHWLQQRADTRDAGDDGVSSPLIDFGIKALDTLCGANPRADMKDLAAPAPDAPVLMPAHVDLLCQTSPRPIPDPDVAAYLHGPNRDSPEVRVCWRADLDLSDLRSEEAERRWTETIDLCPPSTAECLAVPLHLFRNWLSGKKHVLDESGDVLGEAVEPVDDSAGRGPFRRTVLVWRGPRRKGRASQRSCLVDAEDSRRVAPNDTVVIPVEFGGWKTLGHVPDAPADPADDDDREEFPTIDPRELHRLLMNVASDSGPADHAADVDTKEDGDAKLAAVSQLPAIDVADRAFLHARCRTIWRIHPKLPAERVLHALRDDLLQEAAKTDTANLGIDRWMRRAEEIRAESEADAPGPTDILNAPRLVRLTDRGSQSRGGQLRRYPNGLVWVTQRHPRPSLSLETLPLAAFGDEDDSLSLTRESLHDDQRLSLAQHLADVADEVMRLCNALQVTSPLAGAVVTAARFHDVGKADPRFQAMLLDKPLSVTFMQRQLWAKSSGTGGGRISLLPDAFRHEMSSLSLLDHFQQGDIELDADLLSHAVAAHHGYARPFAPLCIDEDPPGMNLRPLGGVEVTQEERRNWVPAHRLDSGIAERFWTLNRRYGWWGLAFCESLLRLADWKASAHPASAIPPIRLTACSSRPTATAAMKSLPFTGIDGSNPLGFLAATGAFRVLAELMPERQLRMRFQCQKGDGAWRPVLCWRNGQDLTRDDLINLLDDALQISPESHPALRTSAMVEDLGTQEAFRSSVANATIENRSDADWLSCNGSDAAGADSISQLQTTRRDYHAINVRGLLSTTNRDHLRRALFLPWDYADPIAGVSLHLEPREDRRHAYQWHTPSGDPTRSTSGGMIGANRLALEAWPLFQSLADGERLATMGFRGNRANNTLFAWPIWSVPIDLATLRSVLSWGRLHAEDADARELAACGIPVVYRCRRILVGKTPNLTSAVPAHA